MLGVGTGVLFLYPHEAVVVAGAVIFDDSCMDYACG